MTSRTMMKPADFIMMMPVVEFECMAVDVINTREFEHLTNAGAKALSENEKAKLRKLLLENKVPLAGTTDRELTEICSVITAREALN